MATHLSPNTLGVSPEVRRLSAPHIPLMVVVTDVDEDNNPENSGNGSAECVRMSKSILKNEKSDTGSAMNAGGVSPNLSGKRVSVAVGLEQKDSSTISNTKPITKWKRICKCFIGLKGKEKKGKSSGSSTGQASSSSDSDKASPIPIPSRSRSNSLHPKRDPNIRRLSVVSISPARSNQSIQSGRLSAKSEGDFYLCDMGNMSEILTTSDIKQLGKHFPPSAVGCPCILTFSSSVDGYSLHNLYRKMEDIDSPVILAILDSQGRAFGALLSCALKISEHFYGSSDSFLFRCDPNLEVFKWQQGGNYFFIHSEENFLRIGAGNGNSGLWIDDNLWHGRTEECDTFGSPPLIEEKDFEVQAVECWTFGHSI